MICFLLFDCCVWFFFDFFFVADLLMSLVCVRVFVRKRERREREGGMACVCLYVCV